MTNTDIGAHVAFQAGTMVSATAGGSGDNVEQNGAWIARKPSAAGPPDFSPRLGGPYSSAVLLLYFRAVLAQGATLTIAANAQTAADSGGTGAADFGDAFDAAVVATGPAGGGAVKGVVRLDFNFEKSDAGPYIREQFTGNLSAANTDTAVITAVWVFGGSDTVPVLT